MYLELNKDTLAHSNQRYMDRLRVGSFTSQRRVWRHSERPPLALSTLLAMFLSRKSKLASVGSTRVLNEAHRMLEVVRIA
jgi:hypothetical protein